MIKRLLLPAFLALLTASGAFAQTIPSANPVADSLAFAKVRERMDSIRQYRPTVGLALAGGGARGMAHLGVIRYIEENDIPVDVITGTSMGALVGGLYAMGYDWKQLDSIVRSINWPVMMSDKVPDKYVAYNTRKFKERFLIRIPFHYDNADLAKRIRNEKISEKMSDEAGVSTTDMLQESISKMSLGMPDGFLYGINVRNLLSSNTVGYQDSISFADLPIPFACVATDIYTMGPKYWTSGNLITAMRSSMAIPFYFRAVRTEGAVLVDGFMQNNFPADVAKVMGADIIIGSEMKAPAELDELNTPADIIFQGLSLMSEGPSAKSRKLSDIYINHPLEGFTNLSFDAASVDAIIKDGYTNAQAHKADFDKLAALVAGKPVPEVSHPAQAVILSDKRIKIANFVFTGINIGELDDIIYWRDFPADGYYNKESIEQFLHVIYGTGAFEAVTYRLEGSSEPYTLVFDCQKGPVNEFAINLHADNDESMSAVVHLGMGTRRLSGPRFLLDAKIGLNALLCAEVALKPRIGLPIMALDFTTRRMKTSSGYMSSSETELVSSALNLSVKDSRMRFGSMKAGLSFEMNPYKRYIAYEDVRMGTDWKSYWMSAFASFKHDTFDDGYFPDRGVRISLDGRYVFNDANSDSKPYITSSLGIEGAWTPFSRFTVLPTLRVGWYSLEDRSLMNPRHIVGVGGFTPNRYVENQLPFFGFATGDRECRPLSGVAQLDLRYRVGRVDYLTLRGGLFNDDYNLTDYFNSYPVYAIGAEYSRQSIAGPLKLALQWCNIVDGISAYISVGFDF